MFRVPGTLRLAVGNDGEIERPGRVEYGQVAKFGVAARNVVQPWQLAVPDIVAFR